MKHLASPVFAGRLSELAAMLDEFDASLDGECRVLLIGAEAGGGKTRLVQEFSERVEMRATVVWGGCTDQRESGLPYAPFTAGIRSLVRERGIGDVVSLIGPSSAGDLAWLLPEFGSPRNLGDPSVVRSRLFEVLRLLIEKLAAQRPLVWILEDLHWADAGTRDLLRYVASNVAAAPVVLVVTHRTEALHRHHPLRPLQAEMGRLASVRVLRLPRLTRTEVSQQLRGILGHEPETSLVNAVYARGDGIPLYAEMLASAAEAPVPDSLQELLLCPVRALPQDSHVVLRAASVAGDHVDTRLMAAMLGTSEDEVETRLQPAMECNVLIRRDARYEFRHQLIREALEGDLMVHERRALHRQFARALLEHPEFAKQAWAALAVARHWQRAGEDALAFAAARSAAKEAAAAGAYVEQLEMLELMLDLWPRVNAELLPEKDFWQDIVEQAANAACWAARPGRGIVLTELGLADARKRGDPQRIASLLALQRAPMRQQQLLAGQLEDLEEALAIAGSARLRAECLAQWSRALLWRERLNEAKEMASRLVALTQQTGDEGARLDARITCAMVEAAHGADVRPMLLDAIAQAASSTRRGAATAGEAEALVAMATPWGWLEVLAMNALVEVDLAMGRHAMAADGAETAMRRCLEVGQSGYLGPLLAANRARALIALGRWDTAEAVVESALNADPPPFSRSLLLVVQSDLAVRRGRIDLAKLGVTRLLALPQALLPRAPAICRLKLELRWTEGDVTSCPLPPADLDELTDRCRHGSAREAWPLLDMAARATMAGPERAAQCASLRSLARDLQRPGPVEAAYAAQVDAELGTTAARSCAVRWSQVAALWAGLAQPFERAYALMRAASVEPSREQAFAQLSEASRLATALNAPPLLERIRVAQQRRRLAPSEGAAAGEATPYGLTQRELQVLELLARGQSNREIATELVISAKTASVHVTNILGKLDVRNRAAAAAVAHRVGLA